MDDDPFEGLGDLPTDPQGDAYVSPNDATDEFYRQLEAYDNPLAGVYPAPKFTIPETMPLVCLVFLLFLEASLCLMMKNIFRNKEYLSQQEEIRSFWKSIIRCCKPK